MQTNPNAQAVDFCAVHVLDRVHSCGTRGKLDLRNLHLVPRLRIDADALNQPVVPEYLAQMGPDDAA